MNSDTDNEHDESVTEPLSLNHCFCPEKIRIFLYKGGRRSIQFHRDTSILSFLINIWALCIAFWTTVPKSHSVRQYVCANIYWSPSHSDFRVTSLNWKAPARIALLADWTLAWGRCSKEICQKMCPRIRSIEIYCTYVSHELQVTYEWRATFQNLMKASRLGLGLYLSISSSDSLYKAHHLERIRSEICLGMPLKKRDLLANAAVISHATEC